MADVRSFKADHERSEFGLAQPLRHLSAKNAALGFRADFAFTSDNEHKGQAVTMHPVQKAR